LAPERAEEGPGFKRLAMNQDEGDRETETDTDTERVLKALRL
jgi:hypothetical protein